MKIHIRLLLILSLLGFLTACDVEYDNSYSIGTVELVNDNSSLSIHEFNFSPYDQSIWGANQISSPLLAGLSFDIDSVPTGTYDARAHVIGLYSSYSTFIYDIPVYEGTISTVVSTDSGYTGSLKIVNGTVDAKIIGLYLSPSSSSDWKENQVDSDVVPSGSMHLFDVATGLHDVKIVWDVGPDTIYYDKSIESLSLLTLTVS